MQLSLTQFQADLIRNSLKLYDIEMLSTSQEWREYDNLFDKLADLSDTRFLIMTRIFINNQKN